MFVFITGLLKEIFFLFIDMAPYLMLGMVLAGVMSVFISRETVVRHIGKHSFSSILKASLFGVPLPLCSCGVIPSAQFLKRSGASGSATMAFLISTPQTGVDSIIATYGLMGLFFAVFRPVAALFTGVWGGLLSLLFSRGDDNSDPENFTQEHSSCSCRTECLEQPHSTFNEKLRKIWNFAFVDFVDDIAMQFIFGILIAGFITYIIPDDFFSATVFSGGIAGMLLMVAVGIPMYICSTTSIPIAIALMAKGISPGAAYVFLIAGPAANAASLSILIKVLGKKETAIYVFSIVSGALIAGFAIDFLAGIPGLVPEISRNSSGNAVTGIIESAATYAASAAFLLLLAGSFKRKLRKKRHRHEKQEQVEKSCCCG